MTSIDENLFYDLLDSIDETRSMLSRYQQQATAQYKDPDQHDLAGGMLHPEFSPNQLSNSHATVSKLADAAREHLTCAALSSGQNASGHLDAAMALLDPLARGSHRSWQPKSFRYSNVLDFNYVVFGTAPSEWDDAGFLVSMDRPLADEHGFYDPK